MRIEFVLPYPLTVNTYWRRRGSIYFVSKAGERYRRDVAVSYTHLTLPTR